MRMIDLPISSMSIVHPDEVKKSGTYRQRRVAIDMPYIVSIGWHLDRHEAFYLGQFFILLGNGATEFNLRLPSLVPVSTDDCFEEYSATFVPGSFRKRNEDNRNYVCNAKLEVRPIDVSELNFLPTEVSSLLNSADPSDHDGFLNLFNNMVNVKLAALDS